MIEKSQDEDKARDESEAKLPEDDVYFFNPWDAEFARDMTGGSDRFDHWKEWCNGH